MPYVVTLKQFDGPLDLLLSLISKAKIDIQDIFVSEITEQYLAYMDQLGELDMDSASEFLQMASILLEIKSRAMLPRPPKPPEDGELTPEEALIKQLTEYKQFKEISGRMHLIEAEAEKYLTKLPEEFPLPPPNIEIVGLTLDKLTRAFIKVLNRAQAGDEASLLARQEVRRDSYTVSGCMSRIRRRLRSGEFRFSELFDSNFSKPELICMFMALLELIKLNRITVDQPSPYEDIILRPAGNGTTTSVEPS